MDEHQRIFCFVCNGPVSHKYHGKYYCEKHFQEVLEYGENVFKAPILTKKEYDKLTKKEKIAAKIGAAEILF